jgi:arabinose-5-phosphate isomerase
MTKSPKTIPENTLAYDALLTMERSNSFSVLPVIDKDNRPLGLIRMHDLLKAGL